MSPLVDQSWRPRDNLVEFPAARQLPYAETSNLNAPARDSSRTIKRIAALTTAALLGVGCALVGLLVVAVFRNANELPPLEPEDFHAAKRRWEESAPTSYNLEVVVTGRQPAIYFAAVRNGDVEVATRDGEPLSRRRTIDTWTVPGMFTTIQADVLNLERHRAGTADRDTPQLLIRGVFDKTHGAPLRYHRTELRKWGPNVEVMWEVRRFEIVGEEEVGSR